jgi:hypothetical protein
MFERLCKLPAVLARYREGPLADARERFLVQCAASGYSRSMLQKIAWVQLAVARHLDLDHGTVTARDLERVIDGRTRFRRGPAGPDSPGSHQFFLHIVTEWMRTLGCLAPPPAGDRPFAVELAAFAQHAGEERGLSPVTIATRCERLGWFFHSLRPPRASLRTIRLADVDAFIEAKGTHGWRRSSLASLAESLRSFFRFAEGQGWCAPGLAAALSPRGIA